MYELRPYQKEAVAATIKALEIPDNHTIIAIPTGCGKSLIIADLVKYYQTKYKKTRVAMLTHNKELVAQNYEKLINLYPEADAGIYCAGLKRKEPDARIVFATIQSVSSMIRRGKNPFGERHLIIVDEAHRISPDERTSYQLVFSKWQEEFPALRIVGLSATPYRQKSGMLYGGSNSLFQSVCYDACSLEGFNQLIDDGYMAPLIPLRTGEQVDLTGIKTTGGDYNQGQLADAVGKGSLIDNAVDEIILQGQYRKSWLVFAAGIENTEQICNVFRERGIIASCVHSEQPTAVNDEIIADFRAGRIKVIVNADMLTTGFDSEAIDLIALLRPTKSVSLYVQMCGRGTRPAKGKENCLVLDFASNVERLGPVNDPVLPKFKKERKEDSDGEPPMKVCDNCGAYNLIAAKNCAFCGNEFPVQAPIEPKPTDYELIADGREIIKRIAVSSVNYSEHIARSGSICLAIRYKCGKKTFTSYIAWENPTMKWKANMIWRARFPNEEHPQTLNDLMGRIKNGLIIPQPAGIEVDVNHRFDGRLIPEVKKELWNNSKIQYTAEGRLL